MPRSSLSFTNDPDAQKVAVMQSPRAQYLATHPEEAAHQKAALEQIGRDIAELKDGIGATVVEFFKSNHKTLWQIGVKIAEFIDTLPGKDLTVDFYEQMKADFVDARQRPIERHLLIFLAGIARRYPDGVIPTFEINNFWRQLPLQFAEEPDLKLISEKPGAGRVPSNPYLFLAEYHVACAKQRTELVETVKAFRENPQFGDFSTLRERRPDLHAELVEKFRTALSHRAQDTEDLKDLIIELSASNFAP